MNSATESSLWASLPTAGVLIDAQDCIKAINPAAEALLNCSHKSMTGQSFSDKVSTADHILPSFAQARSGQAVLVFHDIAVATARRSAFKCSAHISPLADGSGDVILLLQPRLIAGHLGQALQAENAINTAIGLSDMLAHEIKNPLAGITGAAQLLAMNLDGVDLEMTDLIVQESRRILGLLEQVEQFGDLRPPKMEPLNIHDVLERARASAAVGSATKMIFQDDYDPSLPMTQGDEDQLLQVFANLFKNAAQAATGGRGTILIRTYFEMGLRLRHNGGARVDVPLQIEIRDDGPGIAPNIADRLFEPFISGRENGTGLGLALVSKILTQHRGSIRIKSDNKWTVFRISLPVSTQPEEF